MASLNKTKHLFGFTSPRTIEKIVPELDVLQKFQGKSWTTNQKNYFDALFASEYYEGTSYPKNPELAARDRVTRAPKALGFVSLKPTIQITTAGKSLLSGVRTPQLFTRQLLKFQLPSPYHTQSEDINFNIRPYLELLRMINDIGSISKTEISLFFLQLTNFNLYDSIKNKILSFRKERSRNKHISWKTFLDQEYEKQITIIFSDEIKQKSFKTRQSDEDSYSKFIKTKANNMRDYADAFYRYIRATELISIDKKTLHLKIADSKKENVDFLLKETKREALNTNLKDYEEYLFYPESLALLEDNKQLLSSKIYNLNPLSKIDGLSIEQMKDLLESLENQKRSSLTSKAIQDLKERSNIEEIFDIFNKINTRDVPDPPLFLEWNTWRAFAALNHAETIDGNFIMDLEGMPLNTAPGKRPDIEINYGDFSCIIEVTLSSGETQFNMEGSSVPRHFGDLSRKVGNNSAYCIFVAKKISEGTKSHFFNLNRFNTKHYGGKTKIVPMSIDDFKLFIKAGVDNNFSDSNTLRNWLNNIIEVNQSAENEEVWSSYIEKSVNTWAAI